MCQFTSLLTEHFDFISEKKGRYDSLARANDAQLPSSFRVSISDL